jgi:hypothetical protein
MNYNWIVFAGGLSIEPDRIVFLQQQPERRNVE